MKKNLSWEKFEECCQLLAKSLMAHPEYKKWNYSAIVRGGLTFGHRMSRILNVPLSIIQPKQEFWSFFIEDNHTPTKVIIFEDLIAKGRTFDSVKRIMDGSHYVKDWIFIPLLVDHEYLRTNSESLDSHIMPVIFDHTGDWIVFPWEDEDKVVEGDHGLYRDGTSELNK